MEPALSIFIGIHRIRLVNFISVVWKFCKHIEDAYLRKLTDFVLKHWIAPVKVVEVKYTLFLNYKFVVVFDGPHTK